MKLTLVRWVTPRTNSMLIRIDGIAISRGTIARRSEDERENDQPADHADQRLDERARPLSAAVDAEALDDPLGRVVAWATRRSERVRKPTRGRRRSDSTQHGQRNPRQCNEAPVGQRSASDGCHADDATGRSSYRHRPRGRT